MVRNFLLIPNNTIIPNNSPLLKNTGTLKQSILSNKGMVFPMPQDGRNDILRRTSTKGRTVVKINYKKTTETVNSQA